MRIVMADEAGLLIAKEVLIAGGVAVIPTDTVYGLAAHPDFTNAVERLYTIKQRDARKPIALLASDSESAKKFVGSRAAEVGAKHWPGALTIVANGEGVRVPNHQWTRQLLAECGGVLRVTSANLSGQLAATDVQQALEEVGLKADLVVDDGVSVGGVASTVVKVANDRLEILREGPVKFLLLASGSPRRAKILRSACVDFVVVKSDAEEVCYPQDPERTVIENALKKGATVAKDGEDVLSADTIVWLNGKIYGKPKDLNEAREFLHELSGKTHIVFTGVAFNGEAKVQRSYVHFRDLSERIIDDYVERICPTDRAGAYDIDESGMLLISGWDGSYENIMGLPLEPLKSWGIIP